MRKGIMLFAAHGTRPTTYLSTGAQFTQTYTNVIILELRWRYMDVIAGQFQQHCNSLFSFDSLPPIHAQLAEGACIE